MTPAVARAPLVNGTWSIPTPPPTVTFRSPSISRCTRELAVRIDDATPRLIVSASCGIEPTRLVAYKPLLDEAIALATHKPDACIILQRPQLVAKNIAGRDFDWGAEMAAAKPADCVSVAATDPLYILYTSGTTGKPKGIVRDNGGHAVALKWSMKNIYGVDPGEVGDQDTVRQTFERVRQTLIRQLGNPTRTIREGAFTANLVADINNQRLVNFVEWETTSGTIRFGIPRRLDRRVRMEVQYARRLPQPSETLWSIEAIR